MRQGFVWDNQRRLLTQNAKQKLAEKWKELRSGALKVMVGGYSLYEGAKCCICNNRANVRCQ